MLELERYITERSRRPVVEAARDDGSANAVCTEHGVSLKAVIDAVGDAWLDVKDDLAVVEAVARSLSLKRMRERGVRPPSYTRISECRGCGRVWLWPGAPARVAGCPRGWNRLRGPPAPHPD